MSTRVMQFKLEPTGINMKHLVEEIETDIIQHYLRLTNGNVCHAAKLLRMQRTTLVMKRRRYGMFGPKEAVIPPVDQL